jgi:hypothetical protein
VSDDLSTLQSVCSGGAHAPGVRALICTLSLLRFWKSCAISLEFLDLGTHESHEQGALSVQTMRFFYRNSCWENENRESDPWSLVAFFSWLSLVILGLLVDSLFRNLQIVLCWSHFLLQIFIGHPDLRPFFYMSTSGIAIGGGGNASAFSLSPLQCLFKCIASWTLSQQNTSTLLRSNKPT